MSNGLRITYEDRANRSLDDYVQNVKAIWSARDAERGTLDVWLHVINHASKLGEAARKHDHAEIREHLAHFLMWFLTFVGKLETNSVRFHNPEDRLMVIENATLDDIAWEKYPGICPFCFFKLPEASRESMTSRSPCTCILDLPGVEERTKGLTEKQKEARERQLRAELTDYALNPENVKNKPKSIVDWDEMFEQIFGKKLLVLQFESIVFHLLEEIGEISDSLARLYTYNLQREETASIKELGNRKAALKNEIADVISWTFATIVKYRQMCRVWSEAGKTKDTKATEEWAFEQWKRITIPNLIWDNYRQRGGDFLWCPTCENEKLECGCTLQLLTTEESVDSVLGQH